MKPLTPSLPTPARWAGARMRNVPASTRTTAQIQPLHSVLRVAVGMCFIGHGAFGIITKQAWLPYFAVIGIEPALAYRLMPLIGLLDIMVGCAVLIRPLRGVLVYAAVWCMWTAALRPLAGEPLWEMIERAGNYGVPLSLLLLGGIMHQVGPVAGGTDSAAVRLRRAFLTLQWTTALLLVGHGMLLVGGKPEFIAHWGALGAGPAALPWLGGFELLLALGVLARPGVALFAVVAMWKIATESLWLAAGSPIWEWIERAGSYAAPIGAALLVGSAAVRHRPRLAGATPRRRRGAAVAGVLALLLAPGALRAQLPAPDARLLDELREGGLVLLCRHALTDHTQQDRDVDFADPRTQRRLSAAGEAQARELGRVLRELRIPIADVYASPYDRNMRSALLSFGEPVAERALLTRGEEGVRRALLAGPIPAGGNRAIVTHQRTIHLDVELPRGTIGEGACVIIRPGGRRGYTAVAQALPEDFRALLRRR